MEHITKVPTMASALKHYQGIHSVAVIGNYLPRRCGIRDIHDGLG